MLLCLALVHMRSLLVAGANCNIALDNSVVRVDLLTSEFVLQNCQWRNVSLELVTHGPFVIVLSNIQMDGGALTIATEASATAAPSAISLQNSTLVACTDCLHVHATTLLASCVHITVSSSTVYATRSALSLAATRVEHCSMTIRDSNIQAQCSGQCGAAVVETRQAVNVSMRAISSNIMATSRDSSSSSMSFSSVLSVSSATINATNVTVQASACNVTAIGSSAATAMGFASYSSSNSSTVFAANVMISASRCTLIVTASTSVACLGFASLSRDRSAITATNIVVYALECNATASGISSVASMGFVSYSYLSSSSTIDASNITVLTSGCSVAATGMNTVTSMGFSSFSDSSGTINATNVTMQASACNVTAIGSSAATAMGFASYSSSNSSTVFAANVMISASRCTLIVTASTSVACLGFASLSRDRSAITATNIVVYALECNATASGISSVASMGFVSYSYLSSSSTIDASNITVFASGCSVSAIGSNCVSCMGVASLSRDLSTIDTTGMAVYASRCNVTASGTSSVSNMGIASFSYLSSSSAITATNLTLWAAGCVVTATGNKTVANMGVASYCAFFSTVSTMNTGLFVLGCNLSTIGNGSVANIGVASYSVSNAAVIFATNTTAFASGCNAVVTGRSAITAMGFSALSRAASSTVAVRSALLVWCSSHIVAVGDASLAGVAAAVSTVVELADVRWVLLRARIAVSGGSCMTMAPSTPLPSVAEDVELLHCTAGGWATPSLLCRSNVTLNGKTLDQSLTPTAYSGPCTFSRPTSCIDFLPPSGIPSPPFQPQVLPDVGCSYTSTLTNTPEHVESASVLLSASDPTSSTTSSRSPTVAASSFSLTVLPADNHGAPNAAGAAAKFIGSNTVATAIVQVGVASAVVSCVAAMPSAISYASRLGSLAKVADCGFARDVDGGAAPDPFEHPFYFALGSSRMRHIAGAAVLTLLLFVVIPCSLMLAAHQLLGDAPQAHPSLCRLQRFYFGTFTSLCFAYFGPTVLGAGVTLMSLGDNSPLNFLGVLLAMTVIVVWCPLTTGLQRLPLRKKADGQTVWDFHHRLCVTMWIFAEAAAELGRMTSRLYYVEEVLISCAFAALANAPPVGGSCIVHALAMIALAATHLLYLVLSIPYKARLDNGYAIAAGILQFLLATDNIFIVLGAGAAAESVAGALVVVLSSFFFIEAVTGSFVACAQRSRHRLAALHDPTGVTLRHQHDDVEELNNDGVCLSVPLKNTNPLFVIENQSA